MPKKHIKKKLGALGLLTDDENVKPDIRTKSIKSVPEIPRVANGTVGQARGIKGGKRGKYNKDFGSNDDLRDLVTELKTFLIEGIDDRQICEMMGLTVSQYNRLKTLYYTWEIDDLNNKTAEQQYVDYCIEQDRCVKKLDTMIDEWQSTRQYNAIVGAIRAKSQILADKVKVGSSMGIIKNQPSANEEVAGRLIGMMDEKKIRKEIANELAECQNMITKYGDKDILRVEDKHVINRKKQKAS